MVSKARLDLPEPDSPVITTSFSRGMSSEMFLRLCSRAPRTAMCVCVKASLPQLAAEGCPRPYLRAKRGILKAGVAVTHRDSRCCLLPSSTNGPASSIAETAARFAPRIQVNLVQRSCNIAFVKFAVPHSKHVFTPKVSCFPKRMAHRINVCENVKMPARMRLISADRRLLIKVVVLSQALRDVRMHLPIEKGAFVNSELANKSGQIKNYIQGNEFSRPNWTPGEIG